MATERTETAYEITELDADARCRAIESWRAHTAAWLHDFWSIEDDAEHWQSRAAEIGIDIDSRAVPGRTRADGRQATELDVDYSIGTGFSDYVQFNASVRLPDFLRSQRLAGKYRSLYNAACESAVYAEIRESRYAGRMYGARRFDGAADIDILCTYYGYDAERQARIDVQAEAVRELLDDAYSALCSEWLASIQADFEWRESDDAIAEDAEMNAGAAFLEDGSLARLA